MSPSSTRVGHLIIIGGAEEKLRQRQILSRFVALAGGAAARVAVVGTAYSLGDEATSLYETIFTSMGVAEVRKLRPITRAEAEERSTAALLAETTGIFLTGGNQLRLAAVVAGTRLGRALARRHRAGAVVAGTSAGASAIGSEMVAFGTAGATPKQRMTQMSAGLGLLPGVLIDQHFEQRNRIGRLLALVAQSPTLLGIGLDEDTAGVVNPSGWMEVIGKGSITVLDAGHVVTDAPDVKRHRPIMVSGIILHSLPAGHRFDLRRRRLLPPLRSVAATEREQEILRHAGERTRRLARRIAAEGALETPLRSVRQHRDAEASE
jgi:cyanophycinase